MLYEYASPWTGFELTTLVLIQLPYDQDHDAPPLSLLMLTHSISEIKGSIYKLQINMSITRMLHHCYHFLHVRIVQINQRGSILVSHVYLHPYPFFLIDCQSLSFCCMELVKHFPVLMVYSLVYTIMDVVCIADFKQY
jgi:hypothetical protein